MMNEQWRIVAYLDGLQAKINALQELQSASGMPSILDTESIDSKEKQ
jgi:hypothetical protein